MKARVTLKEGLRYHRLDNSFVDLKEGDIIELDDLSPMERAERLSDKHLVPVEERKPKAPEAPAPAKEPVYGGTFPSKKTK
jgi:hypothetical protein